MKLIALVLAVLTLTACGRVDTYVSTAKSITGNLDRTVTLYDANGKPIKSWETSNTIDYAGPVAGFVDSKGKNVRISGTFLIEEK
jgi:hypothetical protein